MFPSAKVCDIMRPGFWTVATLLLTASLLAGCGSKTTSTTLDSTGRPALAADKGAISGLVIDDRYRPIPGANVLLTPAGLTAVADGEGQFSFTDLAPGTYEVRIQADGHEAAPQPVEVTAGQYTEMEVSARRIFTSGGDIITTEFSAFIPCSAAFVVNGVTANCLVDLSGDSYRSGFTTKPLNKTQGVTVVVTEMLANQKSTYSVQVREDNGDPAGGDRYAVGRITNGDYIKLVNYVGQVNTEANVQNNNVNFTGAKPFATQVFLEGDQAGSFQGPFDLVCTSSGVCESTTGVGAQFALKAKFVQTMFIGVPTQDIASYHVLASAT